VMTLIFAFGLCFQLPVLLSLLGRVGIVSSAQLRSVRRYAILGIVRALRRGDAARLFSMISLALPLVFLYEVSIWCVAPDRAQACQGRRRARSGTDIVKSPLTRRIGHAITGLGAGGGPRRHMHDIRAIRENPAQIHRWSRAPWHGGRAGDHDDLLERDRDLRP